MTAPALDRFREAREFLARNAEELRHVRTDFKIQEDSLLEAREEVWRELDAADVKRAVIAKWSGCDPMLVTRALNAED